MNEKLQAELRLLLAELQGLRADVRELTRAISGAGDEPEPDPAAAGFERYRSRIVARREES